LEEKNAKFERKELNFGKNAKFEEKEENY